MRQNILLIVSVVAAALIVGGAIVLAGRTQGILPGPSLNPAGDSVVIETASAACAEGDQCIVVDTHCGFCCRFEAINARFETAFNRTFDKSCAGYGGQSCQCYDLSSFPACVEGRCRLVKWPEGQTSTENQNAAQTQPPAQEAPAAPVHDPQPLPQTEAQETQQSTPAETVPADDLFSPLPDTLPENPELQKQTDDSHNTLDMPLPAGNVTP